MRPLLVLAIHRSPGKGYTSGLNPLSKPPGTGGARNPTGTQISRPNECWHNRKSLFSSAWSLHHRAHPSKNKE